MGDKVWKKWEREVAEDMGGKRAYSSGSSDHSGGAPDVDDIEDFHLECKYRKYIPFLNELGKAMGHALKHKKEGKQPPLSVVVMKERAPPGYPSRKAILMEYGEFLQLVNAYRLVKKGVVVESKKGG